MQVQSGLSTDSHIVHLSSKRCSIVAFYRTCKIQIQGRFCGFCGSDCVSGTGGFI